MKMKKIVALMLTLIVALAFVACGDGKEAKKETPKEPYNLEGEWKQVNSETDDAWQSAIIKDGTITVNWVTDNGDTTSLYWAGTYEAPTKYSKEYKWDSQNDKEQTEAALLASEDDTKEFTYDGKQLTYQVSIMGTTSKVKLERVK